MNTKIEQLQQELTATLQKADKRRKALKISRVLCYGGALIYFIGIIVMQIFVYSGHGSPFIHDYTLNPNPTFWEQNRMLVLIIPLFVLITVGSFGLSYFYQKFMADEQNAVRRIIKEMFPSAKCSLTPKDVASSQLYACNFFNGIGKTGFTGYSFGAIAFEHDAPKLNIQDIVVTDSHENPLYSTQIGGMFLIWKMMLRGIFAKRTENIASSFRGLFADTQLSKTLKGSVIIMPDHLEKHLDYLAKNIQSLKNMNGNKLVQLEDVEFERYFAVYANDEITARYLLTPAMMLRMTELRKKYNRDIMLSFTGNKFFFAVAMPEGFLTLGQKTTSQNAINDLYDNIIAVRTILHDLKLEGIKDIEE